MFLYDVSNNATILISANMSGTASADGVSLQPVFSADGQTLFFQSWAADLVTNDFNHGSDLFALNLAGLPLTFSGGGGSTNSSTFFAQLFPAGSLAPRPRSFGRWRRAERIRFSSKTISPIRSGRICPAT